MLSAQLQLCGTTTWCTSKSTRANCQQMRTSKTANRNYVQLQETLQFRDETSVTVFRQFHCLRHTEYRFTSRMSIDLLRISHTQIPIAICL